MVSPSAGAVVLVPFPFSDLSHAKLRPAVVLAGAGRGDWISCQITSKPYGDPSAISLIDDSFSEGSLRITSYARPGKLFTANQNLMVAKVGSLRGVRLNRLLKQSSPSFATAFHPKSPFLNNPFHTPAQMTGM